MGNPAAGILVLLLALYLLLAFFSGRLEWLFQLRNVAADPAAPGAGTSAGNNAAARWRPTTTAAGFA